MLTLLIILLVIALLFGGLTSYGAYGWSPAGIILVVLIVLLLTGRL
jgi:hypothetical protein